jgi:hypothetical protein
VPVGGGHQPSAAGDNEETQADNDAVTRARAGPVGGVDALTVGVVSDLSTYDRAYVDYPDDEDLDEVDADPVDDAPLPGSRWRVVTVVAACVFLAAVIATGVVLSSDDSGSTTATVAPQPAIAAPSPTSSAAPAAPAPTSPARETVTTVPPTAAPSTRPTAAPSARPTAAPRQTAAPQAAAPAPVNPRTVVYTVTGTKQLFDLVSVFYTDAQGLPHTDVNVPLPWSKTVVLDPNVSVGSVTATSLFSQLNCSIVNAAGQAVAASANNSMIATCTR